MCRSGWCARVQHLQGTRVGIGHRHHSGGSVAQWDELVLGAGAASTAIILGIVTVNQETGSSCRHVWASDCVPVSAGRRGGVPCYSSSQFPWCWCVTNDYYIAGCGQLFAFTVVDLTRANRFWSSETGSKVHFNIISTIPLPITRTLPGARMRKPNETLDPEHG